MRITGIDHVQLAMPRGQEERARDFYARLLGIPEVPKPPELAKRGGAWFENQHLKIHLGVEEDFRPAHKAHPGLRVEGLRGLIELLRENGFAVTESDTLEGFLQAYVTDPFGNRIELIEPLP